MSAMFSDCSLTSLNLANFDTSNVTDMGAMFGFDDMSNLQKKLMEGFLTEDQVLAIKQAYVDTMAAKSSLSGTLDKLGYSTFETPSIICFYPKSFESKERLNELIEKEIKIPVSISDNPLDCVVEGTGICLEKHH